jgi:hypothetical protein
MNLPRRAQDHFYGLREARPDLAGIAVYDRLPQDLPADPNLVQHAWRRREIENYLAAREALLAWTRDAAGRLTEGPLFVQEWERRMVETIGEVEAAIATLGKPSPWSADIKVTDDFLDPLFEGFFRKLAMPNLMRKSDYHDLARFIPPHLIDDEVRQVLDAIHATARRARPRQE